MAATILRNLPTTRGCCTIGQTRHKQHTRQRPILRNLLTTPKSRSRCAAPSAKHNHNTNNTPGNGRNDSAEFTHDTHKSLLHHRPNTTQTTYTPGNGRNDFAEFTHAPTTSRCTCTIAPNTTQTKAGNGRNDCAEFTHAPTVALHGTGPNTNTNKKQSGNGRNDYAEFSHGGHQIPASKNVLKTSFSKGELGTPVPLSLRCRAGLSPARHSSLLSPFRLVA